ncbi:MAG TPA: N,N-dimethylformamidase beta subunit family domain-containing protein [Solirubrobacteraceae bacterium]|nr:N,N-dimethylformamidase beta subunit family domain-containing protein [Solirubrobacteraceae bacterium]
MPAGTGALATLVTLAALVTVVTLVAAPPALAANPIQAENAQPGDGYWRAALRDPISAHPPIQGYAGATSVRPGGTISFAVSTPAGARYRIEISRLGWYGGAGGRRLGCLVGSRLDLTCTSDEPGVTQAASPAPAPGTGETAAGWTMTDTLTVPGDWVSGYYLAVFRLTSGPDAGVTGFTPFIVQAPVGDHSAILVQVPTNTWQAYNTWGGEDFYTTPEAVKVSFDRPYAHRLLFSWEYPLVRFLERGGWDVSYATDDDVDADPGILLNHALDMSAGHDEYWTKAMRDGWDAARDAGVNLAFMGADNANWQVRYEDGRRTMVGYKYLPDPGSDPAQQTTMFRNLTPSRPECELMGVEFQGTVIPGTYLPYTADSAVATDPWFAGSGITPGTVLAGLGGYELDAITPGCHVPPVTPLLSYSGPPVKSNFNGAPTYADAARYTACSGAEVFATGTLQFSWGLSSFRDPIYATAPVPVQPGLQQMMTRALADLTVSHVPSPGPPDICVPAPAFSVPAPWAAVGARVSLDSASTDAYGVIGEQQWTVAGDGVSVHTAGAEAVATFRRPGAATVALRVTDTSGAAATLVKTVRICACPAPPARGGWPAGAAASAACRLGGLGSVRHAGDRWWFGPAAAIHRYAVTVERADSAGGPVRVIRLGRRETTRAAVLPIARPGTTDLIDISAWIAGRLLQQQFVVPGARRPRTATRPWPVAQTTCSGVSGRVLAPVFGGAGGVPLRVLVSAPGRVAVRVTSWRRRPLQRRVRVAGRDVVVSFPAAEIGAGRVTITVSSPGRGGGRVVLRGVHAGLRAPAVARRRRGRYPYG